MFKETKHEHVKMADLEKRFPGIHKDICSWTLEFYNLDLNKFSPKELQVSEHVVVTPTFIAFGRIQEGLKTPQIITFKLFSANEDDNGQVNLCGSEGEMDMITQSMSVSVGINSNIGIARFEGSCGTNWVKDIAELIETTEENARGRLIFKERKD